MKLGCLVLAMEVSSQGVAAERLVRVPEQMVLYVSPNDLRLNVADILLGSKDRLGQPDPSDKTARELEAQRDLPEIQFIDARIAGSWAWSRDYFCHNPAVSSDLILLLRDNRRPGAQYGRPLAGEGGLLWRIDKDYPVPVQAAHK
jgi:esterase/lipase superfamily enzyme